MRGHTGCGRVIQLFGDGPFTRIRLASGPGHRIACGKRACSDFAKADQGGRRSVRGNVPTARPIWPRAHRRCSNAVGAALAPPRSSAQRG